MPDSRANRSVCLGAEGRWLHAARRGRRVAKPAAQWNLASETAGPEDDAVSARCQLVRYRKDVIRSVLPIAVGANHVLVRVIGGNVIEAPLERISLATIRVMPDDGGPGQPHLVKHRIEARIASIVDD